MTKYTIIVPVYNSIQYIEQCFLSIINQHSHSFEVLLVDDGSTDGSAELCDYYANNYVNVRTIHQENGGPASARNRGIRESYGEFIWFIDSDDVIANMNALQVIDNIIQNNRNIDILYFLSNEYNSNFSTLLRSQKQFPYNGKYDNDGAKLLVDYGEKNSLLQIATSPVNKVFRKEILIENNVFFTEQYRCYEEDEFLCKAAYFGSSFYFLNQYLYNVRIRPQSVSTTMTNEVIEKKLCYRISLVEKCELFYIDKEKNLEKTMNKFYGYYLLFALKEYNRLETTEQRKRIYTMLVQSKIIFKCMWKTDSIYLKVIYLIRKLLGVHVLLYILSRR